MQQQLAESMALLDKQAEQATLRSSEHLELQSKIAQGKTSLKELEEQTIEQEKKFKEVKEEVEKEQKLLEETTEAKE